MTSDLSLGKGKAGDFQVTQSPGEGEAKQKVYSLGMEQKEQLADPEVETDSPQGAEKKDQERADPGGSGKAAGRPRPHHGVREEQNTCPTSQRGEGGPSRREGRGGEGKGAGGREAADKSQKWVTGMGEAVVEPRRPCPSHGTSLQPAPGLEQSAGV